jgi:hypothetical protein
MEDRSSIFNNAGVSILLMENGNENVALELFRGALESKLAFERRQLVIDEFAANRHDLPQCPSPLSEGSPELMMGSARPDCLVQAEMHVQNLETYLSCAAPTEPSTGSTADSSTTADGMISVPRQSRGYDPFLYKTPMQIPDGSRWAQLTSSMIVFNLGLVHQMVSRESSAAAVFYEIAVSLLPHMASTSPDELLLRAALLNNFGVWCFENGDGECMRICMEQLAIAMEEFDRELVALDTTTLQGLRLNVQWLLTPLNGGSPAA